MDEDNLTKIQITGPSSSVLVSWIERELRARHIPVRKDHWLRCTLCVEIGLETLAALDRKEAA
jgi:hypothetical protein